jgi:putative addiction module component (TIGR02574 family)
MDYRSVLNEVETWPIDDQVRLVQDLWHRLADHQNEPELTEDMKAEFDRRIEEMDRNPESGLPWEVVKERLLARVRQ